MLGVESGTAEEFYSRCLANAQVLEAAARRRAAAADSVGALADAWGADVNMLQAVMWERILVAARTPQRQFFQVAETVTASLLAAEGSASVPTVGRMIAAGRLSMSAAFDDSLATEMAGRWPDITYLETLPAVTPEDLSASVGERLGTLKPAAFVARRREEAAAALLQAQTHRVRGEIAEAIRIAYEGDFKGLEAYLVESALAAGDEALLSVTIRWDLAVNAVSELPGLPDEFSAAVGVVRGALAGALGEADGRRLLAALVPA